MPSRDDLIDGLRSAAFSAGRAISTAECDAALTAAGGEYNGALLHLGLPAAAPAPAPVPAPAPAPAPTPTAARVSPEAGAWGQKLSGTADKGRIISPTKLSGTADKGRIISPTPAAGVWGQTLGGAAADKRVYHAWHRGAFSSGLFGCGDDCGSCLAVVCCLPITTAQLFSK